MVKHFTSTGYSRLRLFADNGIPPERYMPEVCRTQSERNGSASYTRREPKHDPCVKYHYPKLIEAVWQCCDPAVGAKVESWLHLHSDAFIRQPRVSASPGRLTLEWRYDGQVLRIRFTDRTVFVNSRLSSRGEALEAVHRFNARLIAGEMARIRASGLPTDSPATGVSELTSDDDEW